MKNKKKAAVLVILVMCFMILTSRNVSAETEIIVEKKGLFQYEDVILLKARSLAAPTMSEVTDLEELKSEIHSNLKGYVNEFIIIYNGDTSNIMEYIRMAIDDLTGNDGYFAGTYSSIRHSVKYTSTRAEITITAEYLTNKTQEIFVDAEASRIVSEIIDPTMIDFQKVKAINDWIVNNTEYSKNTITSPHAAYTLFKEGKGVCQAYALAAYRLLEEAGIDVIYVTGKAGKTRLEGHAWNLVKVDGEWYHLDVTWNDPILDVGNTLRYEYFLISDGAISSDHSKDNRKEYPSAMNTKYEIMREIRDPVELENSLYYIKYVDQQNFKIFKLDLDTMKKSKLTDDNAQFVVGYGDWIYYSNYSNGGYLFKIRTDGTNNTQLNSVGSKDLYIEFPYINYYDNVNRKWDRILISEVIKTEGIVLNRTEDIKLTLAGQPVSVEATVIPIDASDKNVVWTSSNNAVATVREGTITAIKVGTAKIMAATVDGEFMASVNVTVKEGYEMFKLNDGKTDKNYVWSVKLNKPIKAETVNFDSVYIENEFGDKLDANDFVVSLSDKDSTIITIVNRGEYEKNRVYYVVADKFLASVEGKNLAKAVKMPFIIK